MSSHSPARALLALCTGFAVALTGQAASAAPASGRALVGTPVAPAISAKKPKPFPLPDAVSWVGGKQLIGTGVLTDLPPGTPAPPATEAASWLVADLNSREILAARRAHVPLAPASTLKIFTALALAPRLDPKTVYTGRDADAAIDGTKVGIDPGSTYTVDDLLHGLLMGSGNDCANALGNLSGGSAKAIALMQEQAQILGAFDTVVGGTSGLDAKGQVSSAYDLALAGSAALKNKQLTKVMQTRAYPFPGVGKSLSGKRKRFQTQNHNRLLANYRGAIGVKNGYTTSARGSFVGAATRNGRTYLAVVMRSEASTSDKVAKLLDWAFANGTKAQPVGTLIRPGELQAMTGPGVDAVTPEAAAAPPPSVGSTVAGSDSGDLRGALPTAGTSLTSRVSDFWSDRLWLGGVAVALILGAFLIGRRPRSGYGRSRSRSGYGGGRGRGSAPRTEILGNGRHRT